jgi:hypothetical protein
MELSGEMNEVRCVVEWGRKKKEKEKKRDPD